MMKHRMTSLALLCLFLFTAACSATTATGTESGAGAADDAGGTETGTSDPALDTENVGTRIESVASSLVLSVNTSAIEAAGSESAFLTYADESGWDEFLSTNNGTTLTDVFGSPDEMPNPVTRIRVVLDQLANDIDGIASGDPDVDCTGSTALADRDTIDVAFFGEVGNGDAEDRYFDCVTESASDEEDRIEVYGTDENGGFHVAEMSSRSNVNEEVVETRGDTVNLNFATFAHYDEATEDGVSVAYLDLHYTQSTIYNGPDDAFGTDDDVTFKSRTRVTGRAVMDSDNNVSAGTGEFLVTKFDSSPTPEGDPVEAVTKTYGRGDFSASGFAAFTIEPTSDGLADDAGTYCIQMSEEAEGLPAVAASENCAAYESAFAWGAATFPFDLTPAASANFEDNALFEGDDTDLIASDGSNFTMPTY